MDEEKMVEQEINVANEVVATIAGMAVSKVDGVAKMAGGFTEGLKAIGGKKQMSRGIKVETDGENVKIEINIIVPIAYVSLRSTVRLLPKNTYTYLRHLDQKSLPLYYLLPG